MQEFKSLVRAIAAKELPNVRALGLVDDNIHCWRCELHPPFDTDVEGGRELNADLARLERARPMAGHILMEIRFPDDYPSEPPLVRVVAPRMQVWRVSHCQQGMPTRAGPLMICATLHDVYCYADVYWPLHCG